MVTQQEYQARRQTLATRLPVDSIAIIPAASELLRNGDSHYRFRQDSDFYYLTGFNEPDALLLITADPNTTSILFNRPRDMAQEQWTGRRLGQDDACQVLGVDAAFSIATLSTHLPELLAGKRAIYSLLGRRSPWEKHLLDAWQVVKAQSRRGIGAPEAFCDLQPLLGEMRLFKSDAEIALMQKAADISVAAHQRAMRASQTALFEYQLEAELVYEFSRQGCRSVAYEPIVASGANACVLHYGENSQPLPKGALVLIDAGGEFEGYAADITRTFPLNAPFSAEQRHIYELVLNAQKAALTCVKPGALWCDMQEAIVRVLTEGLVDLGLLQGTVDDLIATRAYQPFYMHQSGHWLGLDVHDVGAYKQQGQWRALQAGMALTVEPGLYISEHIPGVDPRWWGIGVRIEDDILVTPEGYHNLTGDLVVEVDELEAFLRG